MRSAIITPINKLAKNNKLITSKKNAVKVIHFPAVDQNNKPLKPTYHFYIQGGLHGNEILTSKFVLWLSRRLRTNSGALSQLDRSLVAFDLVPVANPDGVANRIRTNLNSVNLNRNFSYLWGLTKENPGSESFSEPETQSIRYLFNQNKYTAAVDVHGYINWVVSPTKPNSTQEAAKPKAALRHRQWFEALAKQIKEFDKTYELKTAGELGDGGAFEDWAFWEQNSLAFCLEMASAFRYSYNYDSKMKKSTQQDLFEKYEAFIYHMFQHAIKISTDDKLIAGN